MFPDRWLFVESVVEDSMKCSWRFAIFLVWILLVAMPAEPQGPRSQGDSVAASPDWSEFTAEMMKMHAALAAIHPSGDSDVDFVTMMLPHHQAAIDMARTQLMYGKDPQIRRLAQEIITDQQSEIELMQLWLKQHARGSLKASQTPPLNAGKED